MHLRGYSLRSSSLSGFASVLGLTLAALVFELVSPFLLSGWGLGLKLKTDSRLADYACNCKGHIAQDKALIVKALRELLFSKVLKRSQQSMVNLSLAGELAIGQRAMRVLPVFNKLSFQ